MNGAMEAWNIYRTMHASDSGVPDRLGKTEKMEKTGKTGKLKGVQASHPPPLLPSPLAVTTDLPKP